jgi:hypothetical protein
MGGEDPDGMDTIGTYLDAIAQHSQDRKAFLEANRLPFLVTIETVTEPLPGVLNAEGASAATIAHDPAKLRRATSSAREASVFPIQKRAGANAEKAILVGRSRENDLWINDAEISKRHAQFNLTKAGYELIDIGSTNGTFVNDKPIEKQKPVVVSNYDAVRFGRAAKMQFLHPESFFDYLSVLRKFGL